MEAHSILPAKVFQTIDVLTCMKDPQLKGSKKDPKRGNRKIKRSESEFRTINFHLVKALGKHISGSD